MKRNVLEMSVFNKMDEECQLKASTDGTVIKVPFRLFNHVHDVLSEHAELKGITVISYIMVLVSRYLDHLDDREYFEELAKGISTGLDERKPNTTRIGKNALLLYCTPVLYNRLRAYASGTNHGTLPAAMQDMIIKAFELDLIIESNWEAFLKGYKKAYDSDNRKAN